MYLNNNFENPSVAIAYDSRNMSEDFAKATVEYALRRDDLRDGFIDYLKTVV